MTQVSARYTAAEARRVGFDLHLRGEHVAAAQIYGDAVVAGASASERAQLSAAAAATAWAQGEVERCRELVASAMELARTSGDDLALAAARTAQALLAQLDGDDHLASRASYLAGHHARAAGDIDTQVRILVNVSVRAVSAGRYQIALSTIADAMGLQPQMPPLVRAHAEFVRGRALLGLGRADEAFATFDDTRRIWARFGAPQVALAMDGIGETNLVRGRASQAAAAFREAVALARGQHGAQVLVPALAGLARVTVVDDPDECDEALAEARHYPVGVWRSEVELAEGWVALARGRRRDAVVHGRLAEREAGRRHDDSAVADALELISLATRQDAPDGRLLEARMLWEEHGNAIRVLTNEIVVARLSHDVRGEVAARRRLRGLGVRDDSDRIAGPLLAIGARTRAAARVHALGAFTVEREGGIVGPTEWGTPDARRVLTVLAGSPRGITRPDLADLLGGRSQEGLDEVLDAARAVLDPLGRHPREFFVQETDGTVRLVPCTVEVDVVMAIRAAYACLEAPDPEPHELESAVALFTGQFLEGGDEPWAWEVRRELSELSRELRRRLATSAPSVEAALQWWFSLAHEDPADPEAVTQLSRLLREAGRQDEAERFESGLVTRP